MTRDIAFYKVLEAADGFYYRNGYPPTYRDLAAALDLAHSNVWRWIQLLRKEGLIDASEPAISRSILLTDAGRQYLDEG